MLARDADLRALRRVEDDQAWSEVSPLYFSIRAIRFVTPDVALVDARASQFGSLELAARRSAVIVMRREPDGWKVVLVRVW